MLGFKRLAHGSSATPRTTHLQHPFTSRERVNERYAYAYLGYVAQRTSVSDTACALYVAFINGRWPRHSTRGSTPPQHRGNDAGGYSSDSTHRIRCVPHARHWGSPRSEVTPNSGQSSLPLPPLPHLTSRKHCTGCTVHSAPSSTPSHSGQHAHEPTLATQQHSFGRYVGAMLG